MIGLVMLMELSSFALIDRPDPITQERQLAIAAGSDGSTLMIGCAKPHTLNILLKPYRYRRARSTLLFQPHAAYRFENGKPYTGGNWTFGANAILLGEQIGGPEVKAAFLDQLPRNSALHIRYEARPAKEKTLSFLYTLSMDQLRYVVRTCAPREVMRELQKLNSVLATP